MRVGVLLLAAQFPGRSHGEVLAATVEAAEAAERAGFDDVWFAEHHFMSYGVCPSAGTLAAFVLGRTDRIGVGTAVSVLSTQHPVALAEQAARSIRSPAAASGSAWAVAGPGDFEVFAHRAGALRIGFAVEPRRAAGRPVAGHGGRERAGSSFQGRAGGAAAADPAAPAGRSRLHVGRGRGAAAARRLPSCWAWTSAMTGSSTDRRVRGGQGARGRRGAPEGYIGAVVAHAADTRAEGSGCCAANSRAGSGLAWPVTARSTHVRGRDPEAYADLLCRIHPVGTAADCVASMAATAERTGLRHLVCMVEGAGDPVRTRENIARLGAEVLPASAPPPSDSPSGGQAACLARSA